MRPVVTCILFSLMAVAMGSGCRSDDLAPHWIEHPIVIDGDPADWGDLLVEVDDHEFDFGYGNDADYLYLCLSTDDEQLQRQALIGGLSLWFDPAGGEQRVFGVRYPVGMADAAQEFAQRPDGPPDPDQVSEMQAQFHARAAESLDQVVLLGVGSSVQKDIPELSGVEVNSLLTSRGLIIELRVPLRSVTDSDLSLNLDQAATLVGLELYLPELQAPPRPEGRSGGGGGGRGGGMGGGGGRGGGRGRMSGGSPPASVDEVQLRIALPIAFSNPGKSR